MKPVLPPGAIGNGPTRAVLAALQGAATVREAAALMGRSTSIAYGHLCAAHALGLVSMPPGRQGALTARCEFVQVAYRWATAA